HLENFEWRIDDFGRWGKTDLGIAEMLHEPTAMEKNEAAAIQMLETIKGALGRYTKWHPEAGYPSGLKALTIGPKNVEPKHWRFLGLLDASFGEDPLIKDGYRFRYLLTQSGDGTAENPGEFELTAVPIEFGNTGGKGFYIDQKGTLHM